MYGQTKHTLPHTHTSPCSIQTFVVGVCVQESNGLLRQHMSKNNNRRRKQTEQQDQVHDYKILCSEVKLTLWASIKVPLLIEIIAKFGFYKISTNNEYSAVYSSEIFKNFHIFYLPIESSLAFCLKRNF